MSVLVKGMNMPKSCADCRFRTSYDESVDPFTEYCYITNERLGYYNNKRAEWKKERRKNCPLDEVDEEPRNCDRDLCYRNEVNGIGCDECEVMKGEQDG